MNTRSFLRLFVATILAAAALPLFAWDYRTCFGNKITWGSNFATFEVANASFPVGAPRDALNAAMGAWNIAPGYPFGFFATYQDLSGATMPNYSNEIIFTTQGFSGSELAVTKTWNSCADLQEADVLFNANYSWSFETNPTTLPVGSPYSLPLVAIHELGHALGLQHQSSTLTMMAPIYPSGGVVGQGTGQHFQPLADDVLGARVGYSNCCTMANDFYASAYGSYNETQTGLIIPTNMVYRGGIGHYGFSVGNRGTSAATAQVNFYFSSDRFIDTSDTYMGSTTVSLAAGAHPSAYVNVSIPANFPVGNYYFGYIVDPTNAIAEADEANNAVAMAYPTQVPNYSPPSPCFTMSPSTGMEGTNFTFDGTCSGDTDGYIASYTWNYGDGSVDSGSTVSHVYQTPGSYQITLTVTDNQGYSQQTTDNVLVTGSSGCIICE